MPGGARAFGPFLVDRGTYTLTREGQPVALTPKLLDLLLYLVERPATLVTKEELLDALWPDANVTDNALAQAVSELRQVLGDDAAAPTFIRSRSPTASWWPPTRRRSARGRSSSTSSMRTRR
jgi:DNA-binding winged helix-turn-helix (wHTH) protein